MEVFDFVPGKKHRNVCCVVLKLPALMEIQDYSNKSFPCERILIEFISGHSLASCFCTTNFYVVFHFTSRKLNVVFEFLPNEIS